MKVTKSYYLDKETIKKIEDIREKEDRSNDSDTLRIIIKRYWKTLFK